MSTLCTHLKAAKATDLNDIVFDIGCGEECLDSIDDVDEDIQLRRELFEVSLPGHKLHAETLVNLETSLYIRFKRDGKLEDLREVIHRRQQLHSGGSGLSTSTYSLLQTLYTLRPVNAMTSSEKKFAIDYGQACLDSLYVVDPRSFKLRIQLRNLHST